MLLWDLNTDKVTPGQWLRGDVRTECCDVSPDGRFLVIAAENLSASRRQRNKSRVPDESLSVSWTAVCRPPYFTAIALWFMGYCQSGGGLWRSNRELSLDQIPGRWHEALTPSERITVRNLDLERSKGEYLYETRLAERGWKVVQEQVRVKEKPRRRPKPTPLAYGDPSTSFEPHVEALWSAYEALTSWKIEVPEIIEKPCRGGRIRRETPDGWERWSIVDDAGVERRIWKPDGTDIQWIDVDANGRIVFGENGCLWAWPDFPDGPPIMIADLNENQFESVETPDWAHEW